MTDHPYLNSIARHLDQMRQTDTESATVNHPNPEAPVMQLNKTHLIGHLTRDPEYRTFSNGGSVCQFGLALNDPPYTDRTTGQKVKPDPTFVDVKAFNRGERRLADHVRDIARKGQMIYVEGKLKTETWTDQQGQKRSKLVVIALEVQFQPKAWSEQPAAANTQPREAGAPARDLTPAQQPAYQGAAEEQGAYDDGDGGIPF